jgi:5-methylcytosine-specific restriction protein A
VRTPAQRRADALLAVAGFFLDHQDGVSGGRHRPHVHIVVQEGGERGETIEGGRLSAAATARFLCDASVTVATVDERRNVLNLGRTARTVSWHQWAALVIRDRQCRFPGCDRPPHWCEAHHLTKWEDGGPTDLDNLVLGCSRHHHVFHQPGWHTKLLPDGELVVTRPDGVVLRSHPPPDPADLAARLNFG